MSTLHEEIRAQVDTAIDTDPLTLRDALHKVLHRHREMRIYNECGHQHTEADVKAGRAIDVNDVGCVCEDGYEYSICRGCCADDSSQTEDCAAEHDHQWPSACFPCPTTHDITTALGVSTEPAQPTVADLDNCPHGQPWGTCKEAHRGDRCQCNPRRDLCNCDGTVIENCPCYKHLLMPPWPPAEVVPAQAEPRVWQPMDTAPRDGTTILGRYDGVQVVDIRWSEERVCMLASVAPGAGMFGPGWEDVANGLYIDNPEAWMPLSEVTDQAGEA